MPIQGTSINRTSPFSSQGSASAISVVMAAQSTVVTHITSSYAITAPKVTFKSRRDNSVGEFDLLDPRLKIGGLHSQDTQDDICPACTYLVVFVLPFYVSDVMSWWSGLESHNLICLKTQRCTVSTCSIFHHISTVNSLDCRAQTQFSIAKWSPGNDVYVYCISGVTEIRDVTNTRGCPHNSFAACLACGSLDIVGYICTGNNYCTQLSSEFSTYCMYVQYVYMTGSDPPLQNRHLARSTCGPHCCLPGVLKSLPSSAFTAMSHLHHSSEWIWVGCCRSLLISLMFSKPTLLMMA